MITGSRGIALIKRFESLRLTAYQDVAGVWTVGYGHTRTAKKGMRITEATAEQLLKEDLKGAETAITRMVNRPLTQSQFDALSSWTFNLGSGALSQSKLLTELNAKNDNLCGAEFTRWVFAGGKSRKGLARRRAAESVLFYED